MRSIKRQRGFIGALISGAASLLGGGISNAQTASRLEDQHRHQTETMVEQNKFYESMANTAHQREVADLTAAGLNPILSGTGGKGAAVGTGSGMSGASSPATDIVTPAVNTAMQARRNEEEIKNLRETNTNIRADTDKKASERALNSVLYNKVLEEVDIAKSEKEIRHSAAQGAKLEGEIDNTRYGELFRYIDRAMRSILGGSSAYRNLNK